MTNVDRSKTRPVWYPDDFGVIGRNDKGGTIYDGAVYRLGWIHGVYSTSDGDVIDIVAVIEAADGSVVERLITKIHYADYMRDVLIDNRPLRCPWARDGRRWCEDCDDGRELDVGQRCDCGRSSPARVAL